MKVPTYTEFWLVVGADEPEWAYGGSDALPLVTPPRGVCVARVHLDGRVETRAASPSGEPYVGKLLERHPFEAHAVRAFVVSVYGRAHAVVQARTKFEAVRQAGVAPEGIEVRAREELTAEEWGKIVGV
jgi:hypothetical protein